MLQFNLYIHSSSTSAIVENTLYDCTKILQHHQNDAHTQHNDRLLMFLGMVQGRVEHCQWNYTLIILQETLNMKHKRFFKLCPWCIMCIWSVATLFESLESSASTKTNIPKVSMVTLHFLASVLCFYSRWFQILALNAYQFNSNQPWPGLRRAEVQLRWLTDATKKQDGFVYIFLNGT